MRTAHPSALTSSLLFLAALGLGACTREGDRSGATTHTTSAAVSIDDAAGQLAKAHCERQAQCNSLGGQVFSSRAECKQDVQRDVTRDLNAAPCEIGVDKPQVDRCVAVLRDEVCLANMGSVESLPECGAHKLCAH
jgi:hypothetical protein